MINLFEAGESRIDLILRVSASIRVRVDHRPNDFFDEVRTFIVDHRLPCLYDEVT